MKFFDEAGWLANAIGILLPLIGVLLICFRVVRPWIKASRLDSLVPEGLATSWSADKAKNFVRIAIVDDHLQDFPVAELRADQYHIQTYRHVHLASIPSLATYDIVFLDIKGIVKDDPEYGGLKLIAELRRINPFQKICAVSGQTFDPTATEFFQQADNRKRKPLTAQECKAVIEEFMAESFDVRDLLETTRNAMDQLPRKQRAAIVGGLRSYLDTRQSLDDFAADISKTEVGRTERGSILNLARVLALEAK